MLHDRSQNQIETRALYEPGLQGLLMEVLGSRNVYFQPPSNVQMQYPCIKYELDIFEKTYAENNMYQRSTRYQVTYITTKVDSDVPEKLLALPLCSFERFYTADNLYHYVYRIFYD